MDDDPLEHQGYIIEGYLFEYTLINYLMCVSSLTNVHQFVKNLYRAKVNMLLGVNDTVRENANLSCVPKCVYFNDMELLNQQGSVCAQSLQYRSLDNKMQKFKIFCRFYRKK